MINEELDLTIEYLQQMQNNYIEGKGCEQHRLPEWYILDTAVEMLEETKWVPVTKRLPKIAGVYRVTRYYPNDMMNSTYFVDACCFDGCNTWYDDNRISHERAYVDNIIAWQENPEPYKTERSDKI